MELETGAFTLFPKMLPIGPLLATNCFSKQAGHFWNEDSTCLTWLDQQLVYSVIYLAFGSFRIFNQSQFEELALGLDQQPVCSARIRRPSERIAFSRFKNTPDDPVILDEDDGNSVPPANDDVEVVEIYNHSMPMEVLVDSATETEGERSGNEGKLENQPIPMNGVVDSSTVTEDLKMNDSECIDEDKSGVESLMTDLKMNDSKCIDKDKSVGSSSRVTRSQRRKQLEEERSRKESGVQPPNMGAHDAAPKHTSRSVSQRVVVDKNGPPITVWNKKSLKRRERTELEDGGFGFLPLLNIHHTRNLDGKSSTEKRAKSSGIKEDHEATEKLDSLFQSSSASGGKTPNTTRKTGLVNECTDIVLSQQVNDPMKQLWDSPTYVQQVYESMHVSVENSKAMKFLRD
ncbi:hypothetical protein L6452_41480 [Arctium lappa]|uniref:Uncharacterized protein n=1 Tax=Arctium lappa TaxID=4217 RepID=A0ACB8XP98_ARCLA|nr:hypothetical protein L6452_41480 [Arctium lappa]